MNYDDWKLSNPADDGFGYNMVSTCCGAEIKNTDIDEMFCQECGYICDEIEDYEYEELQRENHQEMMRDNY
mgnify:CR=1 FL=1